jgi:hypothetical protein
MILRRLITDAGASSQAKVTASIICLATPAGFADAVVS